MKKHNFSAGPSILSNEVFDKASKSILNFDGIDLSILEISHRSKEFVNVMSESRRMALHLLGLDENEYTSLFLQGGASLQFLMIAYNFLNNNGGMVFFKIYFSLCKKIFNNSAIEYIVSKY